MQAAGPNAEQITYWNETAGPKWVALQDLLDTQIEALGAAVDLVGIETGERVLDVGCGTGQTGAGFSDVALVDHRATLTVGGTGPLDAAIEFLMDMGPAAAALREATDPSIRTTVSAAIRDALAPHHTARGLRMASAAWPVSARR